MSDHWLARPRTVRRLWQLFIATLAVTVGAQALVEVRPEFAIEGIFGFSALYGFVACAALILVARAIGALLKRPASYYRD